MSIIPFGNIFAKITNSDSYEKLWKELEKNQENDLPRKVLDDAKRIFDKAQQEGEFAQLLKSWVTIIETRSNIDPDNFKVDMLDPLPHNGPVQTAIYNAVMASAYLSMTDTSISDFDEETKAEYYLKADSMFKASLVDREALAAESGEAYQPLITTGSDSRLYNHDLLSVLARFAFDHSQMASIEKAELTAELADFYEKKGNNEASTLLKLENLHYRNYIGDYNLRLHNDEYKDALKQLLAASEGLEAYADVAHEYCSSYLSDDEQVDFCRQFVDKYPKAYNVRYFQGMLSNRLRPEVDINVSGQVLANQPFDVEVRYKNITKATLTIRRFNGYEDKDERHPRKDGALVWSRNYTLGDDSLNMARSAKGYPTDGMLKHDLTLPAGHYVFITNSFDKERVQEQKLTSLRLLTFRMPNGQVLTLVRDNVTGRPVSNAMVSMNDYRGKVYMKKECNKDGEAIFPYDKSFDRFVAYLPDTDDSTEPMYCGYMSDSREKISERKVRLFTDRAIYRPGQTVHLAGVTFVQKEDSTYTDASISPITLKLLDANRREVGSQSVKVNNLGSFDADFALPEGLLPGRFTISTRGGTVTFRVEEYKRPTFEVTARNTASAGQAFTFGDTILVEALAKTYAGVPVQEATVKYRIETARVEFWRWWDTDWKQLDEGEIETDDNGLARVNVFLDPKELSEWSDDIVRYRVTFDVTDQAGETQSDSFSLSLSRRSFQLQVKAPSVIDISKDEHQVVISAINANHEPVECKGTYRLCLASNKEVIQSGEFSAGKALSLPRLTSGDYTIIAEAPDRDERVNRAEFSFKLFDSRQEKAEAHFTTDFIHVTQATFSEEQDAEFFFSPGQKDAYVGYHILTNDKEVERQHMTLDGQIRRIRIPYRKEYGDGISLHIYYVRNGHVMQERLEFTYVQPDKRLKLAWSTFRDRLYPGQSEEWILTISDPTGSPLRGAELLATMYDASLDALEQNHWSFSHHFNRQVTHYAAMTSNANYLRGISLNGPSASMDFSSRSYDELTQYIHDRWHRYSRVGRRVRFRDGMADGGMMVESAPMVMMNAAAPSPMVYKEVMSLDDSAVAEEAEAVSDAAQNEEEATSGLRQNFAETAFFYPHLLSDAEGRVHISFTLPESLTEWRFMGLAHDTQVNYGTITANAVARKDFMVQPNMPRFVRDGDKATIAARVINQSEGVLTGKVRMRLLDAQTEQEVFADEQPLTVEAGKTSAVTFTFEASDQYPMLICEIIGTATGNTDEIHTTSDGERQFLPVLPSRKYITEAIPFYLMADEDTKQIDLHELFNNGSPTTTRRRMLLEFTSHPEWTVIEALDGIKLPEYENVPAYAASLYANIMASRIARSIPGFEEAVQHALDLMQNEPGSQLELNQDLRDILLKESPWVVDAINEAEQRSRLVDLFDNDKITQRTTKALERLERLQQSDGSWSWFEGMAGSYYITLTACETLIGLCDTDPAVDRMVRKALEYLDKKEYEAYLEQKKLKLPIGVGEGTLHYLYVCAMMPNRDVSRNVAKMQKEMLGVLAKSVRDLTIHGRAQAACVLRSFGLKRQADLFLESLVEYTVTKPGMGRYYATDIAYYSWRDYRIPTQLAAMRAIKASTRADRTALLNEMQVWLLRQKQAQTWDNTLNTIGAVQFLLDGRQTLVDGEVATMPTFSIDSHKLPAAIDETRFLAPQLGYIRTQVSDEVLADSLCQLSIVNTADAASRSQIAWGAVYAQYLEQMDRLDNQSTGELRVEMRLLDANGKTIDPQSTALHVGERVTLRLVVTADRDMDFVQVRCQRPACFEPVEQRSGFCWMGGRGGYVALHDASTDVFFDRFTRGTTTFDISYNVDRTGQYITGIATAQCAYASEFSAHSAAMHITVE